jgi:hypothetical protein
MTCMHELEREPLACVPKLFFRRPTTFAQSTCAVTAQRRVSPRAQNLRSQGLRSWAQLPSHFPTSPTMHSVERLRRLPALPSHLRPLPIRAIESFRRAEIFGAVVDVRSFVLLLVAHDAFPFPSPSKIISRAARAALAHTDRATRFALLSACSLSECRAGMRVVRHVGLQCNWLQGLALPRKFAAGKLDTRRLTDLVRPPR